MDRSKQIVLVPYHQQIDKECYDSLINVARTGVVTRYKSGCSAIDIARCEMSSTALQEGFESVLFIDSDIEFNPDDVVKIFDRPEPVLSGVYAKKGMNTREIATVFPPGTKKVLFGKQGGTYEVQFAAAGFLRIHASAFIQIIERLRLPACNTHWGQKIYPFFMPMLLDQGQGHVHYLTEDLAFSHRCRLAGITPLADTTIRLFHWGRYGYAWEDAGSSLERFQSYEIGF